MPMKNMFKAKLLTALVWGLGISLVVPLLSPGTALGAGNDITFSADTTINLSGLGLNLTIISGSVVEQYSVSTTTLNFTMAAGSAVTVRSTGFATLTNSLGKAVNCTSTYSFVSFNFSDGASVSITPSVANACSGGGGGGGGGGSSTPPDTTPPTNTSISINTGVATTSSTAVTLTLGAVGASDMMIGNAADFVGSNWVVFSTSKTWTLTSGDGVKNVYAKFKDAAGNISTVISDTITLAGTGEVEEPTPIDIPPLPVSTLSDRAAQIVQINNEAGQVSTYSAETLAQTVGATRNLGQEQEYSSTIVDKVVPTGTAAAVRNQVVSFVTYGTSTTLVLGAGERAGVVNSFREAFGYVPESEADWQDVLKIANGRWPGTLNTEREASVSAAFKKIYLRDADRANPNDDAAITIMAYGLRPLPRNLDSEKVGIKTFEYVFGKSPVTATDWDAVRAIAYSGATR